MISTGKRLTGADVLFRNDGGLLTAEVDDELMALSVEQGVCYGLNAVGTRIWALIAEPRSVDGLCEQLMAEFDVREDSCRREVIDLLEELRADGLVTVQKG